MIQEYTSAKTSMRQVPAGYDIIDKHFSWKPNTINFDIGGGKYNLMTEKLLEKSVTNLLYDPYNRSSSHNDEILEKVKVSNIDTVTIFNVLNVIKERDIQIEVIRMGFNALRTGGILFVRSTYMNPKKVSGVTKIGTFQHYLKMSDYLEIVREVFPNAKLKHGIIYANK